MRCYRDPKLSIDHPLAHARTIAAQALLWQAEDRVQFTRNQLAENPKNIDPKFDFLTRAYLEESNFLIQRAKTINPELNVEQELKQVKKRWEISVEEVRSKK